MEYRAPANLPYAQIVQIQAAALNGNMATLAAGALSSASTLVQLTDCDIDNAAKQMYLGSGVGHASEGNGDTALGGASMSLATSTGQNTAYGAQTLVNITGADCTAIGFQSGMNMTGAYSNTSFGSGSLQLDVIGNYNTAHGYFALHASTGDFNTAVGGQAGQTITTGSNNTLVGANANVNTPSGVGRLGLGYGAQSLADNAGQVGNASFGCLKIGTTLGKIQTGNTTNTTGGQWVLGDVVAATSTPDTTKYLEIMITGTLYKLVVAV